MANNFPYVYKLTHKITGKFYFGSRWANSVYSELDLGGTYFSSSKNIKPVFEEFNYMVLADFYTKEDAFIFEQNLIKENWNNPMLINKGCFGINGKMIHNVTSYNKTKEHRKNMSLAKKGKIPKHSLITMKTWQLIDPEGRNFETSNLSEFCRKYNLNQGSMSAIAQGKQKTYKGWKCYTD